MLRAHVEAVDQLGQAEHTEGHGAAHGGVGGVHVEKDAAKGVGQQSQRPHQAALHRQGKAHAAGEDALVPLVGRGLHHVPLDGVHAQGQGREGIGDQVHPQQLDSQQRRGHPQQKGGEHHQNLPDVAGEQKVDGLADVLVDASPLPDGGHDGGKVVVGEDHIRGGLGHLGAVFAHGAADVRGF